MAKNSVVLLRYIHLLVVYRRRIHQILRGKKGEAGAVGPPGPPGAPSSLHNSNVDLQKIEVSKII